jgi:predicted  nucleic acid-binding Zn-ribbon protein
MGPTPAQLSQLQKDFGRIREKLEKLTGERGDANKTLSAVRRQELQALASLTMQSTQVAAAPTQAEFNALQADVEIIFKTLASISNRLGNATIPKV